jgi:hypothetical protein
VVQFLAVMVTALTLVPAGAHFFALFNKIALAEEQYFIAQSIYRGWSLFGIVLVGALVANLALALLVRRQRAPFRLAFGAFLLMVAVLAVFFVWTYPANQATTNWTVVPPDWRALRDQWEYSHAANAILTFLPLISTVLSTLLAERSARSR